MIDILQREFIYLSYYFEIQLRQLAFYWVLGILIGSFVSVFLKDRIHSLMLHLEGKHLGAAGIVPASFLGVLSPLCMYGTLPIAASFARSGMRVEWLAAFMMSSILLNPQLFLYSLALGNSVALLRLFLCVLCGIAAGFLVRAAGTHGFLDFSSFSDPENHDTDPRPLPRFLKNIGRNIRATGPWFLLGVLLSAMFTRYVPMDGFVHLFGSNKAYGILMAATLGVPLYACGGATVPLLAQWLAGGMGLGNAAAFMITGPATKITNLGALKIVLGPRPFFLYLLFIFGFSMVSGVVLNYWTV
ncbi:MAG: permease [Succiniclasticum sp.]|jgi:uncharacterized protein